MADNLGRGFYREIPPETPDLPPEGVTITVSSNPAAQDPSSGAVVISVDDGDVIVDLDPDAPKTPADEGGFTGNLANVIGSGDLSSIASRLLEGIEHDDQSRQDWLETRASGIEMLGFKVDSDAGAATGSGAPLKGMSTVRHPLLAEAVIRFQSNASGELYPSTGPAKVRDDAPSEPPPTPDDTGIVGDPPQGDVFTKDELADALEAGFNHYLTAVDKGYRPDSVRMLFWVGFGGCGFKKVYYDPIRRMPISRSVDAADLIVSNFANDIDDAGRITHRIIMRKSTLVRMQIAGVYRNVPLSTPESVDLDAVEETKNEIQGLAGKPNRQEDAHYTIYECYCELDIPGFEHKDDKGNPTGLELPYRVTIEKTSRQILEVRRNWREDDQNCMAKRTFVKFPFIPAMGFYDTGLLHLLGNASRALTGAWRIMLDSGMFSSFPGFLYSKAASRQQTNEFRIPPGGGQMIETGGKPLSDVIMALPYKDVSQGLMLLTKSIEEAGQRLGGTAELQVAEGRADAPVGTTLAMIEQATKTLAAVHINLHVAQSEELQLLKECFKEDPEAFWRYNKKPARAWEVTPTSRKSDAARPIRVSNQTRQ